jgi:hypothetical protein
MNGTRFNVASLGGGATAGLLLAALFVSHGVPACSSGGAPTGEFTTGSGGTGNTSNLGGQGGGHGGSNIGGSTFVGSGGHGGGTALDPDAACFTSTIEGILAPLNMFISFDDSGSMSGTKWQKSRAAMISFFQEPAAAGLKVAFRFFGDSSDPCQSCDVAACAEPMVDIGELTADPAPLDAQEELLVGLFQGHQPLGGTPLAAALNGAEQWAVNYASLNPTEKMVVVILTDGIPGPCATNHQVIAGYAEAARQAAGVLTFAIGLQGSAPNLMNLIAQKGGTNQAIMINNTNNADQELLDALLAIRGDFSCEFQVPPDDGHGKDIDFGKVNVNHTPSDGGEPTIFKQVDNLAACTDAGGWYYNDVDPPTLITLCPATCDAIKDDPGGKVNILLGCTTQAG